jgi:hypothetical protein
MIYTAYTMPVGTVVSEVKGKLRTFVKRYPGLWECVNQPEGSRTTFTSGSIEILLKAGYAQVLAQGAVL